MDDNIAKLAEMLEQARALAKPQKQADVLIEIAGAATLFHTPAPDCDAFADITVSGHRETHRVRGRAFRQWLRHRYFEKTKSGVNSEALVVAIETIASRAMFESATREVHVRIAEHAGAIYLDIGNDAWEAIEITKGGWAVVAEAPVRFQRAPSARTLPIPERGGSIQALRQFCNLTDAGFTLFVAVLLAGLRPGSNYPVPVLTGEQGCGKSSLARILVHLVDPRMPEQRSMPRSEEDLLVAAKGQHALAFDNVSGLSDWLSDAFCRLSTGGGAGKRRLYTDEDEVLFSGRRLVCLNGIEDVAVRPDLVDRAVMLALEPIADSRRRDEEEYQAGLDRIAPRILGALLDGVVTGLRDISSVKMANKPRMADFAVWAEACTRRYWPEGTFLQAYRENIAGAVELVLEASAVGDAIRVFMAAKKTWEGTASELLPLLTPLIPEQAARERGWPKRAADLGGKLRRVAPALRRAGIHITFARLANGGPRVVRLEKRTEGGPEKGRKSPSLSSLPSLAGGDPNKINGLGANSSDSTVTASDSTPEFAVTANPLKTLDSDSRDSSDSRLHPSSGNGPVSDIDAVLAELAARRDEDGAS